MAQLFPMPQLGSTMEEGTILKWLKSEGDTILKGETLLEIETDKATMEVESPLDGVVRKLLFTADSVVPVQKPIAILGNADESIDDLLALSTGASLKVGKVGSIAASAPPGAPNAAAAQPAAVASQPVADIRVFVSPRARRLAEEREIPISALAGRGTGPGGRVVERDVAAYASLHGAAEVGVQAGRSRRTTPLAARVADDLGIDLNDLAYGLPGSRVRRDDVMRHLDSPAASPKSIAAVGSVQAGGESGYGYDSRPFAGMRKRIADNVSKSRFTAPHVTLTLEVDMTECANLRGRIIGEIERVYKSRLSFTDIIVKATARALDEHPVMNSALVGDELRIYSTKSIGVAVALDEGLIVPVVQDAGSKSLGRISAELKPLIERARSGKFTPDDLVGGTFTITNLGGFGIDMFDPIIVPPQAGILGVCRIADKPVVLEKQIVIRSIMNLCLSFDHRIVDGVPAARFLQRLKELLENPTSILI